MNRNFSVICYIVSYILSMTCMPVMVTACQITDTMIQQRGDVLVVWQLPAIWAGTLIKNFPMAFFWNMFAAAPFANWACGKLLE